MGIETKRIESEVWKTRKVGRSCPNDHDWLGRMVYTETILVGDYDREEKVTRKEKCPECGGSQTVYETESYLAGHNITEWDFDTDRSCTECGGHGYSCERCMGTGGVFVKDSKKKFFEER